MHRQFKQHLNTWEEAHQVIQHFAKLYAGKYGEGKAKDWKDKIERQAADLIFKRVARPLWSRVNSAWDHITGSGHDLVGSKAHFKQYCGMPKKAQHKVKIAPKIRAAMAKIGPQLNAMAKRGRTGKARGRGMSFRNATDGHNVNDVVSNDSAIRDHFKRRTEKISNINGTSAFAMQAALYLNPGNSTLFPLFSNTAVNYEEYICHFLEFRIGTEAYTSVNSTGSAGKVIMATNFDINDVAFVSDQQMENYQGMRKAPPFVSFTHDVVKAHRARKGSNLPLKNYFVYPSANLSGPNNNGADKFYDLGLFQLATQSNSVTSEIGELYVTYEFTMIRPKQNQNGSFIQAHVVEAATGQASAAAPFGPGGGLVRPGSSIPVVSTTTTISLPVTGNYSISFLWKGTGIAASPTLNVGSALSPLDILSDNGTAAIGVFNSAGTVAALIATYVVTSPGTGANNLMTITGLTSMASATCDVLICQVSTGLTFDAARSAEKVQEARLARIERYLELLDMAADPGDEKHDYRRDLRLDDIKLSLPDREWPVPRPVRSHNPSEESIEYSEVIPPGGPVGGAVPSSSLVRPPVVKQPGWFSKTSSLP